MSPSEGERGGPDVRGWLFLAGLFGLAVAIGVVPVLRYVAAALAAVCGLLAVVLLVVWWRSARPRRRAAPVATVDRPGEPARVTMHLGEPVTIVTEDATVTVAHVVATSSGAYPTLVYRQLVDTAGETWALIQDTDNDLPADQWWLAAWHDRPPIPGGAW